jgi:hypothetical protein
MSTNPNIVKQIRGFLPPLTGDEENFIANLPSTFQLEVPYIKQEQKHWSGAACLQMLLQFYGFPLIPQEEIVRDAGWSDWHNFGHSTFKEKLLDYAIKQGFLVSQYYPALYVASALRDGYAATDFIRSNTVNFCSVDFEYFKALLVSRNAPSYVRLHFTKDDYPMDEPMIEKLDMSGHCVLLVGYDSEGFIYHDPWNSDLWGGKGGGAYIHKPYKELIDPAKHVNYSLDFIGNVDCLQAKFLGVKESVYAEKEITITVECSWSGLTGVCGDWYALTELSAQLSVGRTFTCTESRQQKAEISKLVPGQSVSFSWKVNVGKEEGSFPVDVEVAGSITTPVIPWEDHGNGVTSKVAAKAHSRVCVFNKEIFQKLSQPLDYKSGWLSRDTTD